MFRYQISIVFGFNRSYILASDGDMYISIQIVSEIVFFDYGVLRYLDYCHILQPLHPLYVVIYSQVFTYHRSNFSRVSIAMCLFNPVLDFRYSFP